MSSRPDAGAPLRRWLFVAAAAVPGLALLAFCVVGLREGWLIATEQIAVVPAPRPGQTHAAEVASSSLVPLIAGAAALAATFAWALWRRSTRALLAGYAALLLVVGLAVGRRLL